MRILLGSPDQDGAGLRHALAEGGRIVDIAAPLEELASIALHSGPYDAVIIAADSGRHALPLLREVRRKGVRLPVLVLATRLTAEEESTLLNAGADDVLLRPIATSVLVARLQATARRALGHATAMLRCGNVELDQSRQVVCVDGRMVRITRREFDVLETLMLRRGMVLTKEIFMSRLYGDEDGPDQRILDVYVCKLRRKLAAAGAAEIVRTVWGRGYALEEPTPGMIAGARARHAAGVPRRHRAHLASAMEMEQGLVPA